jgi:4-amino-4-deoxy-L-arabinose transferase-like glycosyltransferase
VPAGHVPSPISPGAIVPICPPGLPLAMAAARTVHLSEFLVVPFLGALAVWLTFLIGLRLDGSVTGAAAAVLTACSPIFLFQLVQPMTDVPATAWWLLVLALTLGGGDLRRGALLAGLAGSMAVLTRPNLLPLAAIVAISVGMTALGNHRMARRARLYHSSQAVGLFLLGLVPGLLLLGSLQHAMYGSPLANGYGRVSELFDISHVVPNLRRYPQWLFATHTPFLALAVAAPAVMRRATPLGGARAWLCLALAAITFACYLPYQVFDAWWYIRFLLPSIPLLVLLSVVVLVAGLRRIAPRTHAALVALVVAVLAAWWVHVARERLAFTLRDLEHQFVEAGVYAAERLPERAAVVTVKYSGSVYYYASRPTVLWDLLDPTWLDPALAYLRERGYVPYLVLATDEEPVFRKRFGGASVVGGLDWPPIARVGRTVRVYDPADRARYFDGETVRTEDVWSTPPRRRRR